VLQAMKVAWGRPRTSEPAASRARQVVPGY
jgi:hypothetical protein